MSANLPALWDPTADTDERPLELAQDQVCSNPFLVTEWLIDKVEVREGVSQMIPLLMERQRGDKAGALTVGELLALAWAAPAKEATAALFTLRDRYLSDNANAVTKALPGAMLAIQTEDQEAEDDAAIQAYQDREDR